eukprot:COSAG06_NODE_43168_length_374_cov_1.272727_1_plen_47_part_10
MALWRLVLPLLTFAACVDAHGAVTFPRANFSDHKRASGSRLRARSAR